MELAPDGAVGQILIRLDVKDLIRCKSVCKLWRSLISRPSFVKAHLKHAYANDYNNPELGHRRICLDTIFAAEFWSGFNCVDIVGSCDGLLCISPSGLKFLVINPSTRELKDLPTPPYCLYNIRNDRNIRKHVCWGFGYDSSADDYKVIVGFTPTRSNATLFHSLSLKSNTWKFIGHINYWSYDTSVAGILCGGELHWIMTKKKKKKNVIISLNISTEEFKEIPLPGPSQLYEYCDIHVLGLVEGGLCIYTYESRSNWVMKNNSWELFIHDHCRRKYDVVHFLSLRMNYLVVDVTRMPVNGIHVRANIFVKSLVSPHPHFNDDNHYEGQKRIAKHGQEDTESEWPRQGL